MDGCNRQRKRKHNGVRKQIWFSQKWLEILKMFIFKCSNIRLSKDFYFMWKYLLVSEGCYWFATFHKIKKNIRQSKSPVTFEPQSFSLLWNQERLHKINGGRENYEVSKCVFISTVYPQSHWYSHKAVPLLKYHCICLLLPIKDLRLQVGFAQIRSIVNNNKIFMSMILFIYWPWLFSFLVGQHT